MELNSNMLVIFGGIANGILLPALLYFIKKIITVTDTVMLMEDRLNTSLKQLESVVEKVEDLFLDNTVNKETLNHLKDEVQTLRKKAHRHASLIMHLELKLANLEGKLEINEK